MFEGFIGNSGTVDILSRMLESGKLPHAIMLEGDEGLGKHTLGLALCRSILCDSSSIACGSCKSCTLFSAGSHPDFSVLSPDSKKLIKVDDIRGLRKKAYEKPDRGSRKVYLIEDAQFMNQEAQNAFLKILEEPPEYVVFVLLATSSSAFLDTVISRCTIFGITTPPYTEALDYITKRFPDRSHEEIEDALSECDCNIGRTLHHLQDEDTSEIYRTAKELMSLIGGRRAYGTLKVFHKYGRDPGGLHSLLSTLSARASLELRHLAMGKKVNHNLSRKDLVNIIESLSEASEYLRQNVSPTLVITRLCAALIK